MELMGSKFIKLLVHLWLAALQKENVRKKKKENVSLRFLMASFFKNIIYWFLAALGLHCFAQALSSYGELLYVAVHGLLIAEASPVCTMALGSMGSEAVAPGL